MKRLFALTVALSAGLGAPILADAATGPALAQAAATHEASVAGVARQLAQARAAAPAAARSMQRAAQTAAVGAADPATLPGLPVANDYRGYPPSCASYPLPDTPSDIIASTRMNLYTRNADGTIAATPEAVTVTIWQLPCSSSGATTPYNVDGGGNALTLMRIQRDSENEGNSETFPTFPQLLASQGGSQILARASIEPNTVIAEAPYDSPIYTSTTYALESYPFEHYRIFYDYAFALIVNPNDGNAGDVVQFSIANYSAPANAGPLTIDGFVNTAWYDPAHGGEGMQVTVFEAGANQIFSATWYTYDAAGLPFWLVAQTTLTPGATSLSNVPVTYSTGGGFAGNFTAVTSAPWGTMNFTFPDCNHMSFDFSGETDAATNGPSGSGSREWQRIANLNGLSCE